ncbi:MAG: hypothetical protein ACOY90_20270 [Candidatus Zhuqueibacterota bacterium]
MPFTHFKIMFLTAAMLLVACTENPFFDDSIKPQNRTFRGQVVLSDHAAPDQVYVWLEGFDIGVWTDEKGNFEIQLPTPGTQAGEGVTGTYKLFYYLANFKLDSSFIMLKNGDVLRSAGDLNEKAEIMQSKYLNKILKIRTEIEPAIVFDDYRGGFTITLSLEPLIDSVFVKFPDKSEGPVAILLLESIIPEQGYFEVVDVNGFALSAPLIADSLTLVPKTWRAGFSLNLKKLPKGRYRIIPYFLIDQGLIPYDLMNDFGVNFSHPVHDFINVPIKREGGELEVKEVSK